MVVSVELNKKHEEMQVKMNNMLMIAPWIMRIVENAKNGVTLQIFEVQYDEQAKRILKKHGEINGSKLRICKEPLRYMLTEVKDDLGNSIGLQNLLEGSVTYRGDIPLDKTVGVKLALVAILVASINHEAKAELISWRIERISAEEAFYWFGKVTVPVYGVKAMQWAVIGMRTILAGPTDQKVNYEEMLEKLRR